MRRSAIVVAVLLLVACGNDDAAPPSTATSDRARCLEAAAALGGLEAPTNLRELQDNAALVAATARAAGVDDGRLAAALRALAEAATDILDAAREGEQALVSRAGDRAVDAYDAVDTASQGMETAECSKASWGAPGLAIPT